MRARALAERAPFVDSRRSFFARTNRLAPVRARARADCTSRQHNQLLSDGAFSENHSNLRECLQQQKGTIVDGARSKKSRSNNKMICNRNFL